jgi:hypothetical protein
MKPILLKLDDELHRVYKMQAKVSGLSLCEWIRSKCNIGLNPPSRIRTGSDNRNRKDRAHAPRVPRVSRGSDEITCCGKGLRTGIERFDKRG